MRAIYREEGGAPVPDFDPALLNIVDRHGSRRKPLPVLCGRSSKDCRRFRCWRYAAKIRDCFRAATLEEMARRHPDCETVTVEGQGHAPLLETGDLPAAIAAFLDRAELQIVAVDQRDRFGLKASPRRHCTETTRKTRRLPAGFRFLPLCS